MTGRRRRAADVGALCRAACATLAAAGLVLATSTSPAVATVPPTLVSTSISGFPATALSLPTGQSWRISALVTGPVGRSVILQRLSGKSSAVVATAKTGTGGLVKFTVTHPRAGRYRLAAPVKGRYKAKATPWRTLRLKPKRPIKWIPLVIAGSFSATETLVSDVASDAAFTWRGSVTWHYDKSASAANGIPAYRITQFHLDWLARQPASDTDCAWSGHGSLTLANLDLAVTNQFAAYDVWGRRGTPGKFMLSVQRAMSSHPAATVTCQDYTYSAPLSAWALYDTTQYKAGVGYPAKTTDPTSFSGTWRDPPATEDTSGSFHLIGTDLFPVNSPFAP